MRGSKPYEPTYTEEGLSEGQIRRLLEAFRNVPSKQMQEVIESGLLDGFCEMIRDEDFSITKEEFSRNWAEVLGLKPKRVVNNNNLAKALAILNHEKE